MQARDIMTKDVVSVGSKASLEEAVTLLLERNFSGLPVVDGEGRLVGMLTEGDLLRRAELGTERKRSRWVEFLVGPGRLADEYTHARGRKVEDVMTPEVYTVAEDAELEQIVQLMLDQHIKRVPVVRDGRPVGLVSRADVLGALAARLRAPTAGPRSDADIAADIRAAFDKAASIVPPMITVSVRNGEVALNGSITDERERAAIKVAVENVPGVRSVHDHLLWIEPLSGTVIASPEDERDEQAAGSRTAA